jgi:hypothetical protein
MLQGAPLLEAVPALSRRSLYACLLRASLPPEAKLEVEYGPELLRIDRREADRIAAEQQQQ